MTGLVAAVALSVSCGGAKTTPTAADAPPTAASVLGPTAVLAIRSSASPALVATGVAVTFDGSQSLGAGLKYQIDFGDGDLSAKATDTHVLKSAGAKTAKLTVTDAAGRTSTIEVPYVAISLDNAASSLWLATTGADGQQALLLGQDGDRLSGSFYEAGPTPSIRPVGGTVSSADGLTFKTTDNAVTLAGALVWKAGSAASCLSLECIAIRLTQQGGVNSGRVAEFSRVDKGPAPVARLNIPSDTAPALGVSGLTPFTFDATGSTGHAMTFRLNFGDGQESVSSRTPHVRETAATARATVTVADIFGRTSTADACYAAASPQTFRFFSEWAVRPSELGRSPAAILNLRNRDGDRLTGTYDDGINRTVTATVTAQRELVVRTDDGAIELRGTIEWSPSVTTCPSIRTWDFWSATVTVLRLKVRGGLDDGRTLIFVYSTSL